MAEVLDIDAAVQSAYGKATKIPADVQKQRDEESIKALQQEYQQEYSRLQAGKPDAAENIRAIARGLASLGGSPPVVTGSAAAPAAPSVAPSATPVDDIDAAVRQAYQGAPEEKKGVRGAFAKAFGLPLDIARQAYGIGEAGAQLVTGGIAAVPAGLGGLVRAVLPGEEGAGAEVTRKVQEALTYQPRTEAGKQAAGAVGRAFEVGAMGAPERGQAVLEATGSPAAAVLAEQLTNPLNYLPVAPAALRGAKAAVRPITRTMGEWRAQIEPPVAPPVAPPVPTSMGEAVRAFRQKQAPSAAIPGGSVGAAGVTRASQVESLLTEASPELQQRVRTLPVEEVNPEALQTRILEEKHGITLTQGQRTGNKQAYASEWNNRGAHPETLGPLFEGQPKQMMEAIDNLKTQIAPDVYSASPSALGQEVINALRAKDAARVADIDAKYQALRDAAGGELPIDAPKLLSNVESRLKKDLHLTDAEGMSQFKELQRLAQDNNMTYDAFLAMRRNLSTEARTNTNGTIRNIAGTMIEELEKLPLQQEAAQLQPLANEARAAAKKRFDLIKANPAYKEAVSLELTPADIEAGIPAKGAELFIDKHTRQKGSLMRLLDEVGKDSPAHQAIRVHELEKLKASAGFKEGKGDFTPRGMTNYLHNARDRVFDIYGPEGVRALQELDILGSKIAQPKANVFNHSNTTAAAIAEMAKQGISSGLEGWAAAHTQGLSIPVTAAGKTFFQNAKRKQYGQKAVDPYSGLSIKD